MRAPIAAVRDTTAASILHLFQPAAPGGSRTSIRWTPSAASRPALPEASPPPTATTHSNHLTSKTYTDGGTPNTSYSYSAGWLTSSSTTNASYAYNSFDGLGRVTSATQTIAGQPPYTFASISYNLLDEVNSMTIFSDIGPWHALWDAVGKKFDVLAMCLLVAFMYSLGTMCNLWLYPTWNFVFTNPTGMVRQ